jgi:hypothetical protein
MDLIYTVSRTPWTGDQPCRKDATYTQDETNTEEMRTDIHASSGIRSHDPVFQRAKTLQL